MTNFNYKARDRFGIMTSGTIEAEDPKAIALQLEKLGYTPISIAPEEAGIFTRLEDWLASVQRVKIEEIIVFTRQLASVLEAGVPLIEGLDAVQQQVKNKKFRQIVLKIKKDIEEGSTFSDALEKHKEVFSVLLINMVRAGEKAGILDEVLDRVSNLFERDLDITNKVKTATRYPMIVLVTLSIAFVVLSAFVIPRFVAFFSSFKVELPLPTRIMIGINYIITAYWQWILGFLFALGFVFKKGIETEKGRYNWDRFILSIPVFGPLFSKIYLSRFCRMLAAMVRSGIPILEALVISSATAENKVISGVIMDVRNRVSQGESLAAPMKGSNIFPPIAVSMVAIGEKAGNLENMLNKVADYFDRETDYTIKNLTPLLEPILIFGLALILLLFALGIFVPMWDLIKIYKTV